MDNLEGKIPDEKLHECAFGYDILFADWGSEYRFLTNIREHRVFCITVITLSTLSKIIFFLVLIELFVKTLLKFSIVCDIIIT